MNIAKKLATTFMAALCLAAAAALMIPLARAESASGTCGDGVTWALDSAGKLTVSGSGAMADYTASSLPPWYEHREEITAVEIGPGVTRIGNYAFINSAVTSVTVPGTVSEVGERAFSSCRSLTSAALESGVKTLRNNAFYFCGRLADVTLPDSLTSIEECAFYGCYALKNVSWPGARDQWRSIAVTRGNTNAAMALFGYDSGSAGYGLTWTLDSSGVLTISGKGYISSSSQYPDWIYFANIVKHIVIEDGVTGICADAFRTLSLAQTLVIPNSVRSIGKGAFYLCSGLKSVTMPGDADYDGDSYYDDPRCFEGCDEIKELTITSDLQPSFCWYYFRDADAAGIETVYIAGEAASVGGLDSLSGLKKLVLSDSVTEILVGAFERSRSLETVEGGGSVRSCPANAFSAACPFITAPGFITLGTTLIKYNGDAETLLIPDGVKAVSDSAFYRCEYIEKVIFPPGLEYIGNNAFNGCTALKEASIPGSVLTIGNNAFSDCTSLEEITVPDSVTSLGGYAFRGCTALRRASLGSGVTALGDYVFRGCSSLAEVSLSADLASIGAYAFENCTSLRALDIPSGTQKIGSGAFRGCAALESAPLPPALTSVEAYAFQDCTALKEAKLPEGLKKICAQAFMGCSSLESITIPASLEELEGAAFKDCSWLKRIVYLAADCKCGSKPFAASAPEGGAACALTVGPGVNSLPEGIFSGADHVRTLTLEGDCSLGKSCFSNMAGLESAVLRGLNGAIPETCFASCSSLRTVSIPRGVTAVGVRAFSACKSLESIELPDTVKTVGAGAFTSCEKLKRAVLGEGIAEIQDGAFNSCSLLEGAELPASLTKLGYGVFSRCDALKGTVASGGAVVYSGWAIRPAEGASGELAIPAGTVGVEDGFISGAYGANFSSVTLPEGLKHVGAEAFMGQTSLTSVTLPSTLLSIGDRAFMNCTSLSSLRGSPAGLTVGVDAFKNTALGSSGDFLIIGAALISYLGSGREAVTVPQGIKSIAPNAFLEHKELVSVTLPEGLEEIGECAFELCESLTTAELPSSIRVLDRSCFYCTALARADIPSGVKAIGEFAFGGSGLTEVTLPEGLEEIGPCAFTGCAQLKSVSFPSTLKYIGDGAFSGAGMAEVDIPSRISLGKGVFASSSLTKITVDGEVMSFLRFVKKYGRDMLKGSPITTAVTESWYLEDNVRNWWNADSLTSKIGRVFARSLIASGQVNNIKDSYDWLCEFCGYQYKTGTHLSASDGPFFFGVASCNGVALAQKCFLDELGYACYLMEGRVNGTYGNVSHAWIEVLSGGWRLIDATDTRKGDYSTYMLSESTAYNTSWDTSHWYTINWDTLYAKREKCLENYVKRVDSNDPLTFTLQEDGTYWVTGCVNGAVSVAVPDVYSGAPVTGVGDGTFRDCFWLESVSLPESVRYIGREAFSGCIGLESITLPASLREMGSSVFYECVSLETADFSRTQLTALPSGTFYHCVSLLKLMLPDCMLSADAMAVSGRGALINATSTEYCMTVYAPSGSAAEARALELGYSFVSTGTHSSAVDAVQLLLHTAVSKYTYKLTGSEADWDVNSDGTTDVRDAVSLFETTVSKNGRTVLAVYGDAGRMLRSYVFTAGSGSAPDMTGAKEVRVYFLTPSGEPERQCLSRTLQ